MKKELLQVIKKIEKGIVKQPNISYSKPILFQARHGMLYVSSFDNNTITTAGMIIYDNNQIFNAVVDKVKLVKVLKSMKNLDHIEYDIEQDKLFLSNKNQRFSIQCISYSSVETIITDLMDIADGDNVVYTPASNNIQVIKELDKVIVNETDEFIKYVNRINAEYKNNKLTLVATDSRRMNIIRTDCVSDKDNKNEFHIPYNVVKIILSNKKDIKTITVYEKAVKLNFDGYTIIYRLVDVKFPDWRGVIPPNMNVEMTIDRDTLIDAVKTAKVIADDIESHAITITAKGIVIADDDFENNTVTADFRVINSSDVDALFKVHADHMLDMLSVMPKEFTIRYYYKKDERFYNRALMVEYNNYESLYLLMPITIE